jgi:hypothetical protein
MSSHILYGLDEKFRGSVEKKDRHHPIAKNCPENRSSIWENGFLVG